MLGLEGRELHSKRLSYRLLQRKDYGRIREILSDGEVTIPAGYVPVRTKREADAFFRYLTKDSGTLAVCLGQTLIGYFHVKAVKNGDVRDKGGSLVTAGFALDKKYHGKGYATEMLSTLTTYLLERFDGCFVDHFEDNPASERVIKKCGYRYFAEEKFWFEELREEKRVLIYEALPA